MSQRPRAGSDPGALGGIQHARPDRDDPGKGLVDGPLPEIPADRAIQQQLQQLKPLRQRLMSGDAKDISVDDTVNMVRAVKDLATIGTFKMQGPVWTLICDGDQTRRLLADVTTLTPLVASLAGPQAPLVVAVIGASLGYIETINELGGNKGVEITGVVGTTGLLVVPRGLPGVFADLVEGAKLVMAGRTVMDFVIVASAYSPQIAAALGIPVVAAVFNAVSSGTPVGWAIAAALGLLIPGVSSEPDPDDHGQVVASRTDVGDWESFTLANLGGRQVALLSHVGLFSAQSGGGSGVNANRSQVGDWERWTVIGHGGNVVSLRTINGHHLTAEGGGGRECNANRTSIGDWERFRLVHLPTGKMALRTLRSGHYITVEP